LLYFFFQKYQEIFSRYKTSEEKIQNLLELAPLSLFGKFSRNRRGSVRSIRRTRKHHSPLLQSLIFNPIVSRSPMIF